MVLALRPATIPLPRYCARGPSAAFELCVTIPGRRYLTRHGTGDDTVQHRLPEIRIYIPTVVRGGPLHFLSLDLHARGALDDKSMPGRWRGELIRFASSALDMDSLPRWLGQGRGYAGAYAAVLAVCWMMASAAFAVPMGDATQAEEEFLSRHWSHPLAPQGRPPSERSALEASLHPVSCGRCHVTQYTDWKTSLHSKSMGPGVSGQLLGMVESDPQTAQVCWRCHAPLLEQHDLIESTPRATGYLFVKNAHFDPDLQREGLSCAGCHVRQHRRFGPPRSGAPQITGEIDGGLPHNGFTAESAFEKSAFCRGCHQFEPDGYALNGKLLENTYEEWRASRHAREGRTCQSCHMPQRRHLWRGIHDPGMARAGLVIDAARPRLSNGQVSGELTITNRNVGHYFPTYVTPKITVDIVQVGNDGRSIDELAVQHIIARGVSLDLTTETFDTRIAPDEVRRYGYGKPLGPLAAQLVYRITVEPDAFYVSFYRARLEDPDVGKGRSALMRALRNAEGSAYVLYESEQPISADTAK